MGSVRTGHAPPTGGVESLLVLDLLYVVGVIAVFVIVGLVAKAVEKL